MHFRTFALFYYRSVSRQVKRNLLHSIKNLIYDFLHELMNNLRVRILGNYEILRRSQI